MSDGFLTPEPFDMHTPPTPVSSGPPPKATKTKSRGKPKGTSEKPTGQLAMLWRIVLNASEINWEKVASEGEYKNTKSCKDSFYIMKKKHLEVMATEDGDENGDTEAEDGGPPVVAKKRKATTKAGNGEAGAKKPRKKAAKDEDEEE